MIYLSKRTRGSHAKESGLRKMWVKYKPHSVAALLSTLHRNERNIAIPFRPVHAINADSSPYTKALPAATDLLGQSRNDCNQVCVDLAATAAWDLPERLRDVLVEYGQNDWCGSSRTVNVPCAQQCSEFFRGDGSAHCAWLGRSWPCSRWSWLCAVPYLQCGQCDKRGTCRGLSKLCRSA